MDNNILRDISQKRFLTKNIAQRVSHGLDAYDDNLNLRRKRLKLLFDEEDNKLLEELKQFEKMKIQLIIQMQKESVEKLELQKNKEKEEMLARKRLQLDMVKCKDIQPLIRRRRNIETQFIQQQQMRENEEKHKKERDVNNMWYYIMLGDSDKKREKEDQEKAERKRQEMERKKVLDMQVQIAHDKQKQKDLQEKEEINKLVDNSLKRNETILAQECQKKIESKIQLKECLKTQIDNREEMMKKEKEIDKALDIKLAKICLISEEEELKKRKNEKVNRKNDLDIYGKYAMAIKSEREAKEKAEEIMVENVAKRQIEENEKQRILTARRSKTLLKEAISGRDAQLLEKKREAEKASEEAAKELRERKLKAQLLAEQQKMEKERDAKAKAAYKQYLIEQMEQAKLSKEREKAVLLSDLRNKLIEEKEFNEKMVDLMKREFMTKDVHPFAKAMEKSISQGKIQSSCIPETSYCKY